MVLDEYIHNTNGSSVSTSASDPQERFKNDRGNVQFQGQIAPTIPDEPSVNRSQWHANIDHLPRGTYLVVAIFLSSSIHSTGGVKFADSTVRVAWSFSNRVRSLLAARIRS